MLNIFSAQFYYIFTFSYHKNRTTTSWIKEFVIWIQHNHTWTAVWRLLAKSDKAITTTKLKTNKAIAYSIFSELTYECGIILIE